MKKIINASDTLAISLSAMCVLHCIALPLVLIVLPSVTSLLLLNDERIHLWLVFAVIPISLFAVVSGYLHHKRASVLVVSAIGLSILLAGVIIGHDLFDEKGETVLTLIGSSFIAFGHFSNFRLRRAKSLSVPLN